MKGDRDDEIYALPEGRVRTQTLLCVERQRAAQDGDASILVDQDQVLENASVLSAGPLTGEVRRPLKAFSAQMVGAGTV